MGLGSALVKGVRGVVSKYQKPAAQRTVKATVVTDTKSNGNGVGGGIKALALYPEAGALLQSYYGLDLTTIPNLNEDQLRELVDYLRQAEWMDDHLPKLEEHIKKYIDRQVSFNQFIATVTKTGLSGAEKIDKAGLDTWLAAKGYKANAQKLGKDADIEEKRLSQEVTNYFDFKEYDLNASLQVMAARLMAQKTEIDARPDKAAAQQEITKQRTEEKTRIKNLITYGTSPVMVIGGGSSSDTPVSATSPMPKGGGGTGWLGKAKDFFSGK